MVDFEAVPGDLPQLDPDILNSLSTDQKMLYELTASIISGHVPSELAKRKIGLLNLARWLTLATRILRLYLCVNFVT